MSAPQAVLDLIEHFDRELDAFKSGKYNEAQLRLQFLDPLFKALGWDMYNESNYAEAYKDVIHEDALRIGTGMKAPDYCFRIGGARKFFVEAKKPSVFIKEELPPAYQLRRYAWTARLPLSVLSDFEEFAIYDCRIRPNKTDKASTARIFYCTFRDLPEKWDYIASIFSKEAVLKGSFDRYAIENKAKRGTAEVDAAFLDEIERLAQGTRPEPRPAQCEARRTRAELRRPAHHRPHHLPAHCRGSRVGELRTPSGAHQRPAHLPAPVPALRGCRCSLQLRPVPFQEGVRPPRSAGRADP